MKLRLSERHCRRLSASIGGLLLAGVVLPAPAACPSHERISSIVRAWEAKEPVRGLQPTLTMADAVCGRKRLVEKLELREGRVVGYKAGLTNAQIQQRFGVSSPVRGMLLHKMLLSDGAEVPAQFGARPVFEADLLVVVKDAAIHQAKTHLEVLRSLSLVIPFIELPDLVLAEGEKITAPLLVLINAGARLGIVGKGIPIQATAEWVDALANLRVLAIDQTGKEIASGRGTAILDHPLNAVLWLVGDLTASRVRLKAGDVLSLGSFTPPLPPKPGTTVTVRYEGLPGDPAVSVRFR
jgi:2-keto-4-pentenoate hydratase